MYLDARSMPPLKSFRYVLEYITNQLIALKPISPYMTLCKSKHYKKKKKIIYKQDPDGKNELVFLLAVVLGN